MTAEEFERGYAERSGLTVEALRQHGCVVRPCDCGEPVCQGWKMAYRDEEPEDQTAKTPTGSEGR